MATYDDKPWLKHYDDHVTPQIPIPDITYLDFLERGLKHDPSRSAFYFLGKSFTFYDLDQLSNRFAAYLSICKCQKGDVVGIHLPNIPQYLIAIAGTFKAGCVVSGVSPLLTTNELEHQLIDSRATVLVTLDVLFQERFSQIKSRLPDLKHLIVTNLADYLPLVKRRVGKILKKIPTGKVYPVSGKTTAWMKEVLLTTSTRPSISLNPVDTCLLQYTGGTTGPSKGSVITHRNLMVNLAQLIQWINEDIDNNKDILNQGQGRDVICSGFPLFHQAGLGVGLSQMGLANTQVLVPDPRNTTQICKDIKKHRPSILVNVPTLYQLLTENPAFKTIDTSSIKFCLSGAAPFDVDSIKALESVVGEGKVIEVYGMTEASPLVTMNPYKGLKKAGSVGIPIQNTRIKIMDVETGLQEVPFGEPGELIVNGPQVMKGYFNKPEATAETIKIYKNESWLYTGDVAKMDDDGFIYIVDRTKDMLLVGGFNVYSKQVEETLYELPEVDLCAIVGFPNPERPGSELVKAVIQLVVDSKSGDLQEIEDNIIAYCRENMAPYKVPKIIEFIDVMPLTAVGKVDKKILRKTKTD